MKCINLCEIYDEGIIDIDSIMYKYLDSYHRIYIGSYFCSRYFIYMKRFMNKLFYYAKHNNMKLTLVIPVFSEKDINISKKVISEIISSSEEIIDEVTVNDLGMLFYIKEKFNIKINLGKLFFKEPRDLRVPEYYYTEVVKPEIAKIICDREIKEHISLIELDEVCNKICTDNIDDFNIGIHIPFCYMSTGNICKFASINKNIDLKFRPNDSCKQECLSVYEHYCEYYNESKIDIYRLGRAIYSFTRERCELSNVSREIYFPFLEIIDKLGELQK